MSNPSLKRVEKEVAMEVLIAEKLSSCRSEVQIGTNLEVNAESEISIGLTSCDPDGIPVYVVIE